MNLCDPGLQMDAQALNARISKLEEQLKTGQFTVVTAVPAQPKPQDADDGDVPPPPDDSDVPPDPDAPIQVPEEKPAPRQKDDTPVGFWVDLANAMRPELPRPIAAFLDLTGQNTNARVRENRVGLICANEFYLNMLDKPEIRELAARKASLILGRPVTVKLVNREAEKSKSKQMEQLMAFGREHSDIIKIKNN